MRRIALLVIPAACLCLCGTARTVAAQGQTTVPATLPLKFTAQPTVAAITPRDLMSRLYVLADDSMMGRQAGTIYNDKGTNYIAAEAKRLGLVPAGDNGTYFQSAKLFTRNLDSAGTSLTIDGKSYTLGEDYHFLAVPWPAPVTSTMQVYYWGAAFDTVDMPSIDQMRDKLLVMGPRSKELASASRDELAAFTQSNGNKEYQKRIRAAAVVMVITDPGPYSVGVRDRVYRGTGPRVSLLGEQPTSWNMLAKPAFVDALLGMPIAQATKGMTGKTVHFNAKFTDVPVPGRNVVAILPGSDPKLKNEYVAIGAHNDHIGFSHRPFDHDSIRAWLTVIQTGGAEGPYVQQKDVTPDQWARINALKDSLRALHGGTIRLDSISNGADDDGSGSVGVLEIAQAFAALPASQRPKRSLLFVWHVGEELGMFGSKFFTDHPTVPRDSIVAQLNVDMIGRGGAADPVPWGGPSYLQLIGTRRLSTELGDIVEQVNTDTHAGFKYDYQFDANGEPHNFYCRSDHWAYGRYGIPIAFFTTGGHRDYHQITDEPQYIDYNHFAHVAQLIHDVAVRVANLDHRPLVDKQKGDPYGSCQQ